MTTQLQTVLDALEHGKNTSGITGQYDDAIAIVRGLMSVDPIYGPEYEAGNWSRRNHEAFQRDQSAAPVAQQAVPAGETVAEILERIAYEAPISGNHLAQVRVLMAAKMYAAAPAVKEQT